MTFESDSAAPLVLVMGYAASSAMWPRSLIRKLAKRFTVVTYDNRGTGRSIIAKNAEEYSIKQMSDDLKEVTSAFQLPSFNLLGYSMGGCIALQHAYDYMGDVRTLFLLSSTAGGALYAKPNAELSSQLANPRGESLWEMYMSVFKLMYSEAALVTCASELQDIFENSHSHPTRPEGMRGHSYAFRHFDATKYLSQLRMPVTICTGTDDRMMPPMNSARLADAIPQAKLITIPNCEHAPHVQEQDRLIAEIELSCRLTAYEV